MPKVCIDSPHDSSGFIRIWINSTHDSIGSKSGNDSNQVMSQVRNIRFWIFTWSHSDLNAFLNFGLTLGLCIQMMEFSNLNPSDITGWIESDRFFSEIGIYAAWLVAIDWIEDTVRDWLSEEDHIWSYWHRILIYRRSSEVIDLRWPCPYHSGISWGLTILSFLRSGDQMWFIFRADLLLGPLDCLPCQSALLTFLHRTLFFGEGGVPFRNTRYAP